MKLKNLYLFSIIGILSTGFGFGWLALLQLINIPFSPLHAYGLGFAGIGLVIIIKTLSTIKKIELVIDELDESDEKEKEETTLE